MRSNGVDLDATTIRTGSNQLRHRGLRWLVRHDHLDEKPGCLVLADWATGLSQARVANYFNSTIFRIATSTPAATR